MTQNPMVRPDVHNETSSGEKVSAQPNVAAPGQNQHELSRVAKTLAAYGGGALAFDLALDLVLNEVVEQARNATGATGAAIALDRGGEMECRATTGSSAPDLGVRLDTKSGLSGACITTGKIQNCSDTEADARVDAQACRQLGVRSMLIIPLGEDTRPFGILEVLSATPNAFGQKDIDALQKLARRIVESKKEAETGAKTPALVPQEPDALPEFAGISQANTGLLAAQSAGIDELHTPRRDDMWTTVLVVLVILVALALGVLIGWRSAAQRVESRAKTGPASAVATPPQNPVDNQHASDTEPVRELPKPQSLAPAKGPASGSNKNVVPTGGLVVTENGKVIYRMPAPAPAKSDTNSPTGRLLHRVEPDYPAEARRQHIQGSVVLEVQVLSDGTVGSISIAKGNPLLAEAAVQAVRQWKYQPYVLDGRSVESQTRVTINFSLPPES